MIRKREGRDYARLTENERQMERLLGQAELVRAELKETMQDMKKFIAQRSK